ncbi:ABC transporter ATP-binding protein [Streptomyces griseocarneus]|uniref:ABC transporter ATP-binding protein n=1 Tax=Streptomyces griseocarneus TaxID=51201 RepID=UPI00167D4EC1|nr:ABC transporter ATP-binding protein [Streptomyces griseocarneus]MBZ6476831.1 ABC transporter ATP-binding protein [Streptomyces griseocarneus]GHG81178.1 ABC transporter ATP-binding protein [Streptomyces griseocarneus]
MATLTAENVCAGYRGNVVLREMNLEYGPGVHILLGPNGSGKTTTFRVLSGLLPPMRGTVLVNGKDPHRQAEAKSAIGLSSHRSALAPRLSVMDNLRYWARVLGLPSASVEARIADALTLLGLVELADRRVGSLSRGQNQRVGLAKAFLGRPSILLLDEPMSGLDPTMTGQLSDYLRTLADDGHVIVASTHALTEAHRLADDVTVLHDGRIVARGEPSALRAALLGSAYRLQIRGSGDIPAALARLGHRWERQRTGPVVVEVASEKAAEKLVAQLVGEGIGIHEVVPVRNPLEDVYHRLQTEGAARDEK